MECIIVYKKDLKYYMFINYIIRNFEYKGIKIIFNDLVSDDLGDIVENEVSSTNWDNSCISTEELKVAEGLYLSKGLSHFIDYFNDEELLFKFNKFILVSDFKKLMDRMGYV